MTGLGRSWFFESRTGPLPRFGSRVIYSERESIFVLCGARGDQPGASSLIWSVQPMMDDFVAASAGDTQGIFDQTCLDVATRSDLSLSISGSAGGGLLSTAVLSRASFLDVQGQLSVTNGDLKCGGVFTVNATGMVNSTGSLYLSGTTRIVQGAMLNAGTAVVAFPLTSILEVDVRLLSNSSTVLVPLFSYAFPVGNFSAVRAINSADSCSVLGAPMIVYGSMSASALVSVNSEACAPGSQSGNQQGALSTEAIVGIVVGAVIGGALVAIAIVLGTKALISHRTATMRSNLQLQDMSNLKAAQATI